MKPSHFGLRGFIPNYDAIQLLKSFFLAENVDFVPLVHLQFHWEVESGGRVPQLLLDLEAQPGRLKVGPPENCSSHKSLGLGPALR